MKPDPGSDAEDEDLLSQGKLKLTVKHMTGEDIAFVVKPTTAFSKVKEGLGKKFGVDPRGIRLMYDGEQCTSAENPKMREMMAGRSYNLESVAEQTGGRGEGRW